MCNLDYYSETEIEECQDNMNREVKAEAEAVGYMKTAILETMKGTSGFSWHDVLTELEKAGHYQYGVCQTPMVQQALLQLVRDRQIVETETPGEYRLNTPIVDHYRIIGTDQWTFVALTPVDSIFSEYSTTTTIGDQRYGYINTRSIPKSLDKLPPFSQERMDAVHYWYDALANKAYELIESTYPGIIDRFKVIKSGGMITVISDRDPVQVMKEERKNDLPSRGSNHANDGGSCLLNPVLRWVYMRDMLELVGEIGMTAYDLLVHYQETPNPLTPIGPEVLASLLQWGTQRQFLVRHGSHYHRQ